MSYTFIFGRIRGEAICCLARSLLQQLYLSTDRLLWFEVKQNVTETGLRQKQPERPPVIHAFSLELFI